MTPPLIYPQLSGQNWPSYLLQVWLTLHRLGVPPHNIRFVPEIGHFAAPEVTEEPVEEDPERHSGTFDSNDANRGALRHPHGPQYDPQTGRVRVYGLTPEILLALRPRLKVNVHSDTRVYFAPDENGDDHLVEEEQVGRLAHFAAPLLAGLNGLESASQNGGSQTDEGPPPLLEDEDDVLPRADLRGHSSLARLTRQLCARYPELIAVTPPPIRAALSRWAEQMERALTSEEASSRSHWTANAAHAVPGRAQPEQIARWFAVHAVKLQPPGSADYSEMQHRQARSRFMNWGEAFEEPETQARTQRLQAQIESCSAPEREEQRQWLRALLEQLARDTVRERYKIVRELVEIITTETFTTVAVLDALWGIGWAHGRIEDFREPDGKPSPDGLLLSMTGGFTHRSLLLRLVKRWANERRGFLGVNDTTAGYETVLRSDVFSEPECEELWSLVSWRREAPDPLLLLQLAARRLVHPDVQVHLDSFQGIPARFNTLLAQPGKTAVLGGMAQVLYPGVVIYVPLSETAGETARHVQRKLRLILSLFLPVCMRAQIVWQEAAPYLPGQIYLKHPFQQGIRLGKSKQTI